MGNNLRNALLFTTDLPHPYNKIGDGPEGPEVRTVADKLRPYLVSRVISKFYKGERAKSVGLENLRTPATITSVRSHGKKIIFDLSTNQSIIISLGMVGRLQYTAGDHSHVSFEISDSIKKGLFNLLTPAFILYYDDYRYMGAVDCIPTEGFPLYFRDIGPDLLQLALDEKTWISLPLWLSIFQIKKTAKWEISKTLLEQNFVSGIGWYLVTEILYYSGIHPERIGESITTEEWDRIRINSHKIINLSYAYGGFTIKDFISPDGKYGTYPAAVYGKTHDPMGNIVINKKVKNGRTAHYVPAIQH